MMTDMAPRVLVKTNLAPQNLLKIGQAPQIGLKKKKNLKKSKKHNSTKHEKINIIQKSIKNMISEPFTTSL